MLIAQISDLHLRSDGSRLRGEVDPIAELDAAIDHVCALVPAPDLVLVTGDLADIPVPADYVLLRAFLDRLPMPTLVIPGNHDDRESMRAVLGGTRYLPASGEFIQYAVEKYPVRLIALDTLIPGEVGGGLCTVRLQWLAERLAESRGTPTLIFMHHPPFITGIRFLDVFAFSGASELEALIRANPQVRLVVCGHFHRSVHRRWADTIAVIAPSTVYQMNLALREGDGFAQTTDPAAIALYLWEDGCEPIAYTSLIEPHAASTGSP